MRKRLSKICWLVAGLTISTTFGLMSAEENGNTDKGASKPIPVEKSNPKYDLYKAAKLVKEDNLSEAWELTVPKVMLLQDTWDEFSISYVAWTIEQLRLAQELETAREFVELILNQPKKVKKGSLPLVKLLKADILKEQGDKEAARKLYDEIMSTKGQDDTQETIEAKFNIIELKIDGQEYDSAATLVEPLLKLPELDFRADAWYYYARIAFERGDYIISKERLQRVFTIEANHTRGGLLEGDLKLELPRGLQVTELKVGDPKLQNVIIPGQNLRMTLQDRNLAVARDGGAVPIVVTTSSENGDKEHVDLRPTSLDPTLFIGTLDTELGRVVKNDGLLQVKGNDVVKYQIHPEFQKANKLNYEAKNLDVKAAGELQISAVPILSEEKIEQLKAKGAYERRMDDASSVRPGNPFYARVTDHDRDLSDQRDTVVVDVASGAGDIIENVELTETEPHSGVFEGQIPTALPAPIITASDAEDGAAPWNIINRSRNGVWRSKKGGVDDYKWLELDTMSSYEVDEVRLEVPDAKKLLKDIALEGALLNTEEDFFSLGVFPASNYKMVGGLEVLTARADAIGRRSLEQSINNKLKHAKGKVKTEHVDAPVLKSGDANLDFVKVTKMTGKFFTTKNEVHDFMLQGKPANNFAAFLFVDGKFVVGGRLHNKQAFAGSRLKSLPKGIHTMTLLVGHKETGSSVKVAHRLRDGTIEPFPAARFDPSNSEALHTALSLPADISLEANAVVAKFQRPQRLRKLRWVFNKFQGKQLEVNDFVVKTVDGDTPIPVKELDFEKQKNNQTLEVGSGGTCEVTYADKVRLNPTRSYLTASLDAFFKDGSIAINHGVVQNEGKANEKLAFTEMYRFAMGDEVHVEVRDNDLDKSGARDQVNVMFKTSSGTEVTLPAVEKGRVESGEVHNASFYVSVIVMPEEEIPPIKTDEDGNPLPRPNYLPVQKGDLLTVSYEDTENSEPGVPIERSAEVVEAGLSDADLRVMQVQRTRTLVEDEGVNTGENAEDETTKPSYLYEAVAVFPEVLGLEPELAESNALRLPPEGEHWSSLAAPLMFQVTCPSLAKHEDSTLTAELVAESELKAAQAEGREPRVTEVPMGLVAPANLGQSMYDGTMRAISDKLRTTSMLAEEGHFGGAVKLVVGDFVPPEQRQTIGDEDEKVFRLYVDPHDTVHVRVMSPATQKEEQVSVKLRSNGFLELLDSHYVNRMDAIHLGQKLYVQVTDADQDVSEKMDVVEVDVASYSTDKEEARDTFVLKLNETGPHSGVFNAGFEPRFEGEVQTADKVEDAAPSSEAENKREPEADQSEEMPSGGETEQPQGLDQVGHDDSAGGAGKGRPGMELGDVSQGIASQDVLEVRFGDHLTFEYVDEKSMGSHEATTLEDEANIFYGSNMAMACFSKKFASDEIAAATFFNITEAKLKVADGYEKLDRKELAEQARQDAEQILSAALQDYPNSKLADQGYFLLGEIAKKLGNYRAAEERFSTVLARWPNSDYAPKAMYQRGLALEKDGRDEKACEEYVRLTYMFPDSTLVGDATARLGNYFYRQKLYGISGEIFHKFQIRNKNHELAPKALLLAGISYIQDENYEEAAKVLAKLVKKYKKNPDLRAQGMYRLGSAYMKAANYQGAYESWKQLTWDHPETKWAQVARGKLQQKVLRKLE